MPAADPTLVGALAAGVLGVALFCSGRLVVGALRRRPVERDVDLTHVVMGVSMAGMLTGRLAGNWNLVWIVAFSASALWFARRTRQGILSATRGTHDARHLPGGGHVQHVVASVAMLYMVVAMHWLAPATGHNLSGGMAGMTAASGVGSGIGIGTPFLAFAVAGVLVLDASISATRVLRAPAMAGGGDAAPVDRGARPLVPRGTAACTLVMSLAMAYMFVAMHP